jgi:NADPH:quinone reductase
MALELPVTMSAISVDTTRQGPEALVLRSVDVPAVGPGQILIQVRAAGVNRPDLLQRVGKYPPPPGAPDIMGLEVAGEVVAVSPEAGRWKVGDKVVALLGGGGYAQFVAVDARSALPLPSGVDFTSAAAFPETVFTVWANVFERGRLQAGETLLVHGGNSGIGVTAIQMAKAAGARVIATARGEDHASRLKDLGADVAIDSTAKDFSVEVRAARGVDVVLDMIGADYFARNLAALRPGGRLVQIAFLTGSRAEFDIADLMKRGLTLTGSTLRYRPADEKARLGVAVEKHVWPWIQSGAVRPIVDHVFPLEEAWRAHALLEQGSHFGKVILTT